MDNDNPFRRHSTLLGVVASAPVVATLGWATKWNQSLMIVYILVGVGSVALFSRVFYGFKRARVLDGETLSPGSIGGARGIGWNGEDIRALERAYEKMRLGDVSEFERLAKEEEGR